MNKDRVGASPQQMIAVRIPQDAPRRALYGTTPFLTEYLLTIDDAARLLADLQAAVLG